jgi:hypothetical protein
MDSNAISAIQDKLRRQAEALGQSGVEVPLDWPVVSGVRVHSSDRATRRADFSTTVETLKQRSAQPLAGSMAGRGNPSEPTGATLAPDVDLEMYQRRLQSMVKKINHLSLEQERVITEMQRIYAQIGRIDPAWQDPLGEPLPYPSLDLGKAAIAQAHLDAAGNIALASRPIDCPQPQQEAQHLAAHLRHTYGSLTAGQTSFMKGLGAELKTLWQEPRQGLAHLWRPIQRAVAVALSRQSAARGRRRTSPHRSLSVRPLTVIDAVIWVGGGVIGRVALSLLLSAFPSLWSLAVIAITAATAYALYKATLAPNPDFGLAGRVMLALGGLIVGGRF